MAFVPGIVDPRPAQRAQLRHLREQLGAATDTSERRRIEAEIADLEQTMGRGGGLLRKLILGWGHRSLPW
jgi:hypothetical protein